MKPDILFFEYCCNKTTKKHGKFELLKRGTANVDLIYYGNYAEYEIYDSINLNSVKHLLYPLLLTKAIEGVNMSDPWKIDIFYEDFKGWSWSYKDYRALDVYYDYPDQAKEAALEYLMVIEMKAEAQCVTKAIKE